MYIRATYFLTLKSKIPEVLIGKKNEWIILHQKRQIHIYVHIRFTAKITFFSCLRFFN